MKRLCLLAALILLAPCLLLTVMSVIFLLGSVGMLAAFVSEFDIENRTDRPIWVTPVGTINSGEKWVLPQYSSNFPAAPAFHSKDIKIDSGSSTRVRYDWDDINFTEIVVRDEAGEYRRLIVDPNPPARGYHPNQQERYVVEDWDSLCPVPEEVLRVVVAPDRGWVLNLLLAAGFLIPLVYFRLLSAYRSLSRRSVAATGEAR